MRIINQYLGKQGISKGLINEPPVNDLGLVIVIPAYKERNISLTLDSLSKCALPNCGVEVIVHVNGLESDSAEVKEVNQRAYEEVVNYTSSEKLPVHVLKKLNFQEGGVGLARKTLMDEALFRLASVGVDGVIANLDADCTVAPNYLQEIMAFFTTHTDLQAATVHYEHDIQGPEIMDYELHLRYFIGMQRFYGFPFAFQTVGSAMVARASGYAKVGGMNRKKAGEDFYFLHKFIKIEECGALKTTTVYPSGRVSDRVPFGTGKAVGRIRQEGALTTYKPESFKILSDLVRGLKALQSGEAVNFNRTLVPFLEGIKFNERVAEIRRNTRDYPSFRKRFFQFFDAFQLMKALHYLRDNGCKDVPIEDALRQYFLLNNLTEMADKTDALNLLRKLDRE